MGVPEPLARQVSMYKSANDPFYKAWRLIDTFELALKWETAVVIGHALDQHADHPLDADLCARLARNLERPSLGHWVQLLRTALAALPKKHLFRRWDRFLPLEQRHGLVRWRNIYAHGAVPHPNTTMNDCENFAPVLDELLASPFFHDVGIWVRTARGVFNLGGPQPPVTATLPGVTQTGTFAWLPIWQQLIWVWPMAAHRMPRAYVAGSADSENVGLYFHNSLRSTTVETLNYDIPDLRRDREPRHEFIARTQPDCAPQQEDEFAGASWARVRTLAANVYGRGDVIEDLRRRLIGAGGEHVVLGPPGQGKSAVLAELAADLEEDVSIAGARVQVLPVFLRRGVALSRPPVVLRQWVSTLARASGQAAPAVDAESSPSRWQVDELALELETLISRWSKTAGTHLIFIVDGLDEQPGLLPYLPHVSETVSLVWSARPTTQVMETVRDRLRVQNRITLGPVDSQACRAMLYQTIDKYHPGLTVEFVRKVAETSGGNPLFVATLAERYHRDPESVGKSDILPTEIRELYEEIVRPAPREGDGGADAGHTELICLLAVAQAQLTQAELAALLGQTLASLLGQLQRIEELLQVSRFDTISPAYGLYHDAVYTWLAEANPDGLTTQHLRLVKLAGNPEEFRAAEVYLSTFGVTHLAAAAAALPPDEIRHAALMLQQRILEPSRLRRWVELVDPGTCMLDLARLADVLADAGEVEAGMRLVNVALELVGIRSLHATPPSATLPVGVLHDMLVYRADQRFADAVFERIELISRGEEPVELELRVILAGRLRRRGTDEQRERATRILDDLPKDLPAKQPRIAGRAHYEQGYLHHLEDRPDDAVAALQRSQVLSDSAGAETSAWIARVVCAQLTFRRGQLNADTYGELLHDAGDAFDGADSADTAAARWVGNVLAHRFDLAIDIEDLSAAADLLAELEALPWHRLMGREEALRRRRRSLQIRTGQAGKFCAELAARVAQNDADRPVREGRPREYLELAICRLRAGETAMAREAARKGLASRVGCGLWAWRADLQSLAV